MLGTKYETPKRLQKDIKARKSKDLRKNNIVDPFFIEIFGIFCRETFMYILEEYSYVTNRKFINYNNLHNFQFQHTF